jgi:beta-galactosidase/beta-glucuronidase
MSKHAKSLSLHGYPRPQLCREAWTSLDGTWDFAIDATARWTAPDAVKFDRTITVPFAPETPASGIEHTDFMKACWYRREIPTPKVGKNQRVLLHFEAVDYEATVWVNNSLAVRHEGGYTPFSADITELLTSGKTQAITVRAEDDPADMAKPRGKQDWKREPHSIWYQRTSGIWQPVWLEVVNTAHIQRLRWGANADRWEVSLHAHVARTNEDEALKLRILLKLRGRTLCDDLCTVTDGVVERVIVLPDPGIDDARGELFWSPFNPNLIDAELELIDADGKVCDRVTSYTAMRSVQVSRDRFVLNGRPLNLELVLDQGYWPETGLTAPDDDAYRRDVELAKQMGFNGVRKHQKIESARFLYWADKLGLMVWEEMPSCYTFSSKAIRRMTRQWMEAIERDASHPCIIAWVPFNESWGVPDLPISAMQRHAIQALYHLTKTLDASRPVIGNDGWEAAATDIIAIHDYEADPRAIARRYDAQSTELAKILHQERPGHRVLLLEEFQYRGQPIMLTEFGGIAYSKDQVHTWGYSRAQSKDDFADRYHALLSAVRKLPILAGFCYTQFTDTYQEANGLLYMDRTPKFPIEEIAIATRGIRSREDEQIEAKWRERMMSLEKR